MKKLILPICVALHVIFPSYLLSQNSENLMIKDYISKNMINEYKKHDLIDFTIENRDTSKFLNGNVVKFQQMYKGIPIYNSAGSALIKDNKVIYYSDNFLKDYNSVVENNVSVNKVSALQKIADHLQKEDISSYPVLEFYDATPDNTQVAKQRLVYYNDNNNLRLAYEFILREPKSSNLWNILLDANDGTILEKVNLNLSCNFHSDAYKHMHEDHQHNIPESYVNEQNIPFLAPDNATYNVFALPTEAPTFGSRSILSNPWILSASPEGWHSDGTNHYTITRGNNVFAYEDSANQNAPGSSPDGGPSRNFNFSYSNNGTPLANRNAAITNLFYMNNRVHDIFYKLGFTESARNFQKNNFGNGGAGNDHVEAEGQDGGGLNNANFGTPPDGSNPFMQMYLWSTINKQFFYNSPSSAQVRNPNIGLAEFGSALNGTGVTANVVLPAIFDGCSAMPVGSLAGKIGLIERGNCSFVVKVKNAQNAGAAAVIIYNNATNGSALISMGGSDATITIPSVLITNDEGVYIKSEIAANMNVNVTLKNDPSTAVTPDGSFDNGIITHEYGHGISNRLTGNGYSCLNSSLDKEQMGEGWSDFFAIMLTNKSGDNALVPRGVGTYAIGQGTNGSGIRPAKYSPNFSINDYTYGDTNGLELSSGTSTVPNVHAIGFIWATMLWDLHWKYVEKYGYSSDVIANTTSGSSRVLQLVTNALKLQPCNPTFVDGRNAILAAEQAATSGVDKCMIWSVFAKRGLGVNASAGSKTNINDQIESFAVPVECNLSQLATDEIKGVESTISIYPNPAKNEFYINFPSNTMGKVSVEMYDMSGKLISSEDKIAPDTKKAISTEKLINGTYMIRVKGLGFDATSKVIIKK
ncbi:T9SS-dependent M36 family metallopeptidase [Chryseobacterium fistulae]|uniref:Thermostable neutral protease NprT n=1 Tax=Chryseobacterium fistulae TaxID=2675058 RepID=A0A6N4XWV4_9FLAO|nr:T9SS-dependent M36 family metallopeptidase [Chryseobacterium fistulae]CAA7391575.1 Thermostable neutral protease NprT [Chryseobacterium fistulae]